MKGLSIIVPAFNEEGNIISAVGGVLTAAAAAGLRRYEVIIVDDGSTDGTYSAALCTGHTVVRHPTNLGLRAAYETGLARARYDHVTWVPGDDEIAMESLFEIFKAVGMADIIAPYHGTPHKRPWYRRALTLISTTEINLLFGHRKRYFQGPNCYPTALARSLPRTTPGFLCMAEMYLAALELGYQSLEVPLTHQERMYGVSKAVSWKRIWDAQLTVMRLWWRFKVRREVRGLQTAAGCSI